MKTTYKKESNEIVERNVSIEGETIKLFKDILTDAAEEIEDWCSVEIIFETLAKIAHNAILTKDINEIMDIESIYSEGGIPQLFEEYVHNK